MEDNEQIQNLKNIIREKSAEISLQATEISNLKTKLAAANSYISELETKNTMLNEANLAYGEELSQIIKNAETLSTHMFKLGDQASESEKAQFHCDENLLGNSLCYAQCDQCKS